MSVDLVRDLQRVVGRAVVHHDHLGGGEIEAVEHRTQPLEAVREASGFVIAGDDE